VFERTKELQADAKVNNRPLRLCLPQRCLRRHGGSSISLQRKERAVVRRPEQVRLAGEGIVRGTETRLGRKRHCGSAEYGASSNEGWVWPLIPSLHKAQAHRQRTLASPLPHLQFLLALSKINPANAGQTPSSTASRKSTPQPSSSSIFPSTRDAMPPPAARASSSSASVSMPPSNTGETSRQPLQETNTSQASWKGKGRTKADMLKSWRTAQGMSRCPKERSCTC